MAEQATVVGLDLPAASRVTVKIGVSTEVNISAFAARQKANDFLVMQAGDQLLLPTGPATVPLPAFLRAWAAVNYLMIVIRPTDK